MVKFIFSIFCRVIYAIMIYKTETRKTRNNTFLKYSMIDMPI